MPDLQDIFKRSQVTIILGRLNIIQLNVNHHAAAQSLLAQTAVDLNVDIMLQVIITFILFACTIELGMRIEIGNPVISKKNP